MGKNVRQRIVGSFKSSKHRWRTARGISKDTKIPLDKVVQFLEQSADIVRSKKANKYGQVLYTLTTEKRLSSEGIRESEESAASVASVSVAPYHPFVAHAYADRRARDDFLRRVDQATDPFFFAPIKTRPDELVSSHLIDAIFDCDSLIYFDSKYSGRSFWVAFERDFAARVGKPIYRFEASSGDILRVEVSPMHLPVFPVFSGRDFETVVDLLEIMRHERNFDLFIAQEDMADKELHSRKHLTELYKTELYTRLNQGGYVVVFWSQQAERSERVARLIERTHSYLPAVDPNEQKLLFGLLDPTPLPDWYADYLSGQSSEDFVPIQPVKLFADEELSLLNRLDDLIVRLYWLIWRNTYSI